LVPDFGPQPSLSRRISRTAIQHHPLITTHQAVEEERRRGFINVPLTSVRLPPDVHEFL
jgi:hypothetical protein